MDRRPTGSSTASWMAASRSYSSHDVCLMAKQPKRLGSSQQFMVENLWRTRRRHGHAVASRNRLQLRLATHCTEEFVSRRQDLATMRVSSIPARCERAARDAHEIET